MGDTAPDVDAATSRVRFRVGVEAGDAMAASDISVSSPTVPSSDEDALAALLTGMTRAEEAVAARRGRFFDGVSGENTPSSSSDADTTSENATLRFVALLGRKGVRRASRIADLVGDADRECEGVLIGVCVFDVEAVAAAAAAAPEAEAEAPAMSLFLRISLTVARMDSFKSTHSSSSMFTRRLETLSETPYLLTNCTCCTPGIWDRNGSGK